MRVDQQTLGLRNPEGVRNIPGLEAIWPHTGVYLPLCCIPQSSSSAKLNEALRDGGESQIRPSERSMQHPSYQDKMAAQEKRVGRSSFSEKFSECLAPRQIESEPQMLQKTSTPAWTWQQNSLRWGFSCLHTSTNESH